MNPDDFIPGLDLQMMNREMYWASAGYLWEMQQKGPVDPEQMEKDWKQILQFWKNIYSNKEKKV